MFEYPSMFAYLDPGTGSMLLQFVVATSVSTAFILRKFLARPLVSLLSFRREGSHNDQNPDLPSH